jgi:hypothetical protein
MARNLSRLEAEHGDTATALRLRHSCHPQLARLGQPRQHAHPAGHRRRSLGIGSDVMNRRPESPVSPSVP